MADRDAPNYIFRPPSSMDRERGSLVTMLMSQWFLRTTALVVFLIFGLVVWFAYVEGSGGENGESALVRAPTTPDKVMVDQASGAGDAGKPGVIDVARNPGNTSPRPEKVVKEADRTPPADQADGESLDLDADAGTAANDSGAATDPAVAPGPTTSTGAVTGPATPPASPATPPAASGNLAAGSGQPSPSTPAPAAGGPVAGSIPQVPEAAAPVPAAPAPMPSSPAKVPTTAMVITTPPAMTPTAPVAPTLPQIAVDTPEPADEPTPPAVTAPVPPEPPAPATGTSRTPSPRTAMVDPPRPVPPAPKPVVVASGKFRIQLASVRDPRAAAKTWQELLRKYPKPLAGVDANVVRAEADGATVYRVQAGPYASRDAAAARCRTITAAGGACFVVGSGS